MTPLPPSPAAAVGVPDRPVRSELDVAAQQLRALERFHRARRMREEAAAAAARTREQRMDAARSLEVLRRQHQAVVALADEQLRASGQLLRSTAERRVVLAHRDESARSSRRSRTAGLVVVARTDDGAEAVGVVVAEQPDLVLVEDTLAMLPGLEVIRAIRHSSPDALVAAQSAHEGRAAQLRDAGATTVLSRGLPPHEVARALLLLLGAA